MSLRHITYSREKPMTLDERMFVYGASQKTLWEEKGAPARRFLFSERKLDPEVIAGFRLGYVPSIDHPFSERVVMPIFDSYDKLLALSVRPTVNDKETLDEYIKYWNESYPKGEHLFGLNRAKMPIVKNGFAILVEGQMDVMAMHSFGFDNTVGVLGGAFTPMQAVLLRRWTEHVVVMFDNDTAGNNHLMKAFEILRACGYTDNESSLKAVSVKLAAGKDPNEALIRHGSLSMRKVISESLFKAGIKCPPYWER
jgi:DNA primase catalytic core